MAIRGARSARGLPCGKMEFMGHSRKSLGITVGVYGHATPEAFERPGRRSTRGCTSFARLTLAEQ